MFSMTCFVCIIMIRVHFYDVHVVSLNTHDIAHVIIEKSTLHYSPHSTRAPPIDE